MSDKSLWIVVGYKDGYPQYIRRDGDPRVRFTFEGDTEAHIIRSEN